MAINIGYRVPRSHGLRRSPIFYFTEIPPVGNILLNHPSFCPSAIIDLNNIDGAKPSGATVYVTGSLSNFGSRFSDWQEFFGLEKGDGPVGNGDYAGIMILRNFGSGSLLGNTLDACGTGVYNNNSFYCATGTSQWASTGVALISGIYSSVTARTGIFNNGLAYPQIGLIDNTEGFPGILALSGSTQIGWWPSATGDTRYTNQTICQVSYGTGFANRTLSDMYNGFIGSGGSAPDISLDIYATANSGFYKFWQSTSMLVKDYVLQQTIYNNSKTYFPNIRMGCTNVVSPSVSTHLYLDESMPVSGFSFGKKYNIGADFQCIKVTGQTNDFWQRQIFACSTGNNLPLIAYFTDPSSTGITTLLQHASVSGKMREFIWASTGYISLYNASLFSIDGQIPTLTDNIAIGFN